MQKLLTSILLIGIGMVSSSFAPPTEQLTKEDRKEITKYLKKTRGELIKKVESLTQEQWHYKPAPEVWSIAEISEHILKAESVVLKRVDSPETMEYKPELMEGYKEKGEEMIAFIVGRQEKFQAPDPVAPSGNIGNPDEFITAFEKRRDETVEFVKSIDKPIKAYYEVFGPVGEVSGYHWLMFISAHTERHMIQLTEVLNSSGFPI
ncbi:MAG: DinB family protein [Cyclobacteriaceae bacterium]